MTYIPDLTERFPEGFRDVESHDKDDCYELFEEETQTKPKKFKIGNRYRQVGAFGGVTNYIVKEIDRENSRILLDEVWQDVDGTGTRPAEWHKLEQDENGNEKALEWTSEKYGNFWIYAKTY